MKTAHRFFSVSLAFAVLVASTAMAQTQDYEYVTNNGTITITGYTGSGGEVIIPETLANLPVTRIEVYAFQDRTNITTVTIPASVRIIGAYAFSSCKGLTNVVLGPGPREIGYKAFLECEKLPHINISENITHIGVGAFSYCSSLQAITVDPHNPSYCSIEGVLFNKTQTTLMQCPGGKSGSYVIPESVLEIGEWAFGACALLTEVTMPANANYIGDYGFCFCNGLSNINIGQWVTKIGYYALTGCFRLGAINVDALNSAYSSSDGILYDKKQSVLIQCPPAKTGSYIVPDTVKTIGDAAFYESGLTNVSLNQGITSIGGWAFDSSRLVSIAIPNTVTNIGVMSFGYSISLSDVRVGTGVGSISRFAFYNCTSLTNVDLVEGVSSLRDSCLRECTSLARITIPDTVSIIETNAFFGCTNLTAVHFQGNVPSMNGKVFDDDSNATVYYLPGTIGWGTILADRPTALWVLPYPVILATGPDFGVRTNAFGFRISWVTNSSVVVEASTNLDCPWVPMSTNPLAGGWCYYSDPERTKYPARFYRVRHWQKE